MSPCSFNQVSFNRNTWNTVCDLRDSHHYRKKFHLDSKFNENQFCFTYTNNYIIQRVFTFILNDV